MTLKVENIVRVADLIEKYENNFDMGYWCAVEHLFHIDDGVTEKGLLEHGEMAELKNALQEAHVVNGGVNWAAIEKCGTQMCIAGWAAACHIADGGEYRGDADIEGIGAMYLGLDSSESLVLFHAAWAEAQDVTTWLRAMAAAGKFLSPNEAGV